jgi:hypothetical protein
MPEARHQLTGPRAPPVCVKVEAKTDRSETSAYRKAKLMIDKTSMQPASPRATPPQAKSRFFTTGVVVWSSLAAASLLYLLLLATQPEMVARLLGSGSGASADSENAIKAASQAVAEVGTLRDTVDQFRSELIEMRAQVSSQTEGTRELASRIETLETASTEGQRIAGGKEQGKLQSTKTQKAAPPPAKTASAEAKKKIETGSVAQPATGGGVIAFGPPTVTPAALPPSGPTKLIGVQIATGPSVDSLRLNWALLADRHGETLRAFQPRYVSGPPGAEPSYDLVVGPLASVEEATRLCNELALKATPCSLSRYTGDAL